MTAVDWDRWRKCPVCASALGEPCVDRLSVLADGRREVLYSNGPHGGRKPRTGGA